MKSKNSKDKELDKVLKEWDEVHSDTNSPEELYSKLESQLILEKLEVSMVQDKSSKGLNVVVNLPSNRKTAIFMLAGICNTMKQQGNDDIDTIMEDVKSLLSSGMLR